MKMQSILIDIMQREGITQSELADKLDISRQAMSKMLKGNDMKLSTVLSILEILGYSFMIEKDGRKT